MEDRAYRNAMKRRRELQVELGEIDKFIDLWKRYAGTEPEQLALETSPEEMPPKKEKRAGRRTKLTREQLAPFIRDVLIVHGEPMTRGQLVEALVEKKIAIGGTDPRRNLGTIMWRLKDEFTNIEGRGYWPKSLPCEAAGYDPENLPSGT